MMGVSGAFSSRRILSIACLHVLWMITFCWFAASSCVQKRDAGDRSWETLGTDPPEIDCGDPVYFSIRQV